MKEFDAGPPAAIVRHLAELPSYRPHREMFWYDWGPVFYRGRLDGSARLLGIASDPGPTERIACRTLVGDAGQRVQGFLAKLGLTRSYALVNAFAYALRPSEGFDATDILAENDHLAWRNALFNKITGPALQVIVVFGRLARVAVDLWQPRPDVFVCKVPHPSSHEPDKLVKAWREAVIELRGMVTPDPDGDPTVPNYGTTFLERDYARVPAADLPFGLPAWFGDDAWGRQATPRHNNSVGRPSDDPLHTLVWRAPSDQP